MGETLTKPTPCGLILLKVLRKSVLDIICGMKISFCRHLWWFYIFVEKEIIKIYHISIETTNTFPRLLIFKQNVII